MGTAAPSGPVVGQWAHEQRKFMTADTCAGHACDCVVGVRNRRPGSYAQGWPVQLWSGRRHVRARVARLLGDAEESDVLRPPDQLSAVLDRALAGLGPTEVAELVVVHRAPDGPDVIEAAVTARLRLDSPWLPRALEEETLRPWFQPLVDLRSGRVHGREALLRLRDDGELRDGTAIVEAARAHGQLYELDQVGRRLAIEHGGPVLPDGETLYVNYLPTAIYDPAVCLRTTWAAAQRVGIGLDRVCFEVAESEQVPHVEHLVRILDIYRQEGARVALDDLGAGWMSLNYVRQLRPDVVKLDRELVSGLGADPARERLVRALVDYAHELDIQVVAEGIETPADLSVAHALGVDLGQGYLLGAAEPTMQPLGDDAHAALADLSPAR